MRQTGDVTVLVVDDDPDVTTFLGTILGDAGMKVVTAHDGREALERLEEVTPDLISLDLVMPGKSGVRLLHDLRKHPTWQRIPVIIVTGHARDAKVRGDLDQVLAESAISGPSVYLEKPVTPRAYLEHVCRVVGVTPPGATAAAGPERLKHELAGLLADADEESLARAIEALKAGQPVKTPA
jgi:CheY-like chemotaxis protein